ncbi:TPA: hypothetical protein ACFP30_000984 [Neisseria oralis]
MDRNSAENIIAEVFRHSGVRLTADDPIVTVLLMQEQMFRSFLSEYANRQDEQRIAFLEELSVREGNIIEAAAKMETYREQLVLELTQYANKQLDEVESKIYGGTYKRIARDVETANGRLVKRLEKLLIIALITALAVLLLAVSLVWVGR